LQKLAAEADADVANVADDLEKKKPNSRQKAERDALSQRIASEMDTIAALQGKSALPDPENVRHMRRPERCRHRTLHVAGYCRSHRPAMARRGRRMLRGYTSVILLDKASDAAAAYRIGEKQKYSHFIVPERISAPVVKDQSLLSVVNFHRAGTGLADRTITTRLHRRLD
jgi:hypothetical protein